MDFDASLEKLIDFMYELLDERILKPFVFSLFLFETPKYSVVFNSHERFEH